MLFYLEYVFRIRTESTILFPSSNISASPIIFDFFLLDDPKFEDFYLFKNIWRETLLLQALYKQGCDRVFKVKSFGQLPNKVVYREVEEVCGETLEDYLGKQEIKRKGAHGGKEDTGDAKGGSMATSKQTFLSELCSIDLTLRLLDLLDTLHSRDIIHTNFAPSQIFLV